MTTSVEDTFEIAIHPSTGRDVGCQLDQLTRISGSVIHIRTEGCPVAGAGNGHANRFQVDGIAFVQFRSVFNITTINFKGSQTNLVQTGFQTISIDIKRDFGPSWQYRLQRTDVIGMSNHHKLGTVPFLIGKGDIFTIIIIIRG